MTARVPMLAALLLCAAQPQAAQADPGPIAGGWSEVPRAALASEVRQAARFAVAHLPGRHGRLRKMIGAERQIVAGTNYRMLLTLSDGHKWRVQVWKKLDGTMELTHFQRGD